jgi:hypothetical protein
MPGGQDVPDTGAGQRNEADRDVYAAGPLRLNNLAHTYRNLGRPADALPLEERAGQIRQRSR